MSHVSKKTYNMYDAMSGICAYDGGETDSGIHDEMLRAKVKEWLDAMSEDQFRLTISHYVRTRYLDEDALSKGYGIEDVVAFLRWLDHRMGISL